MSQVANLRILLKTALPIGKEKKKKKFFLRSSICDMALLPNKRLSLLD